MGDDDTFDGREFAKVLPASVVSLGIERLNAKRSRQVETEAMLPRAVKRR